MRFDLTDLRLFLLVVETGSITRGAERAHMALAAASARVRAMEESLGVPLLERGRRGVRPTPAGTALAHHARLVAEQVERLRGELAEHARGLRGHVRLVGNTAALSEFLPDALAAYLAANPAIDVEVAERPSHAIARTLLEGRADLGILADHAVTGGLACFPFRSDRLVAVVPVGHPLAGRRRVAFAEVAGGDVVGLCIGSALQEHLGEQALRAGRPLRLRVRVPGFEALCRMVGQGVGLAVAPETAVRRCRRAAGVRGVPLSDPWALRRLVIAVQRDAALPLPALRLLEHLRGTGGT